jgi:hypothetical protein
MVLGPIFTKIKNRDIKQSRQVPCLYFVFKMCMFADALCPLLFIFFKANIPLSINQINIMDEKQLTVNNKFVNFDEQVFLLHNE